jgi:hypothetical protein
VTDVLDELRSRLQRAARRLREDAMEPEETLAVIEECARLASDAATEVNSSVRAALEPLPDLPGQLPLQATEA